MSIEGQGLPLPFIFQIMYVLCFTRPRYQVSVYRTIGPLVLKDVFLFHIIAITVGMDTDNGRKEVFIHKK